MSDQKVLVVYSGGMDSFTLLHHALQNPSEREVGAISFNYGQRHVRELECARKVCRNLQIEHTVVDMQGLGALLTGGGTSLIPNGDNDVPEGHYAAENMHSTVVPNRNMIMLSIAAGFAAANGYNTLATAVHAGDHHIYPDCRPEFIRSVSDTLRVSQYQEIHMWTPYLTISKGDILRQGLERVGLRAEEYADTWTCYKGGESPCGRCGSCVERLESFHECGAADPLPYADREFWKGATGRG